MPTIAPARGDDANPLLELVDAATQRLQTAEPVSASKWNTGGSIEDPQRVEQVLAAVSADATGGALTPNASGRYSSIRSMPPKPSNTTGSRNGSSIRRRRRASRLDLASSRSTIDRLNTEMVEQIAVHWSVLQSPDCAGTLADARAAVTGARTLDPLYQQALYFSTHSYCH